ncbi:MAG: glycosyltransferase family 1 protein, partial [Nitrospirales bacterium]|nr:glycosyltransferase family 1 protein [Nitrospirales bacterium]
TINGALEIAHLPGVFISAEVTTYFPEDGCKLHVVVLDITEAIFSEIMQLRRNVYELQAYLRNSGIAHFVAHPLYDMNGRLSADTIEKILLLFETIEVKNGSRARQYNRLMSRIISSLTPEMIGAFALRHNLEPSGEIPWVKATVGGSDDHSGFFIARAHTVSPIGADIKGFIRAIREKQTEAAGEDGDALILAHSIYGIGYRFYKEGLEKKGSGSFPFISALMSRAFAQKADKTSLYDRINLFVRKRMPEIYDGYDGKSFGEILDREAKRLLNDKKFLASISSENLNRRIFAITSSLVNRLMHIYTERLARQNEPAGIMELFNSMTTIGLIHLLTSPYYVAFHHQHRSKPLMRDLDLRFGGEEDDEAPRKIALFTDTLDEINGVAITIRRLIETARQRGVELVVITSGSGETGFSKGVMNFTAVGSFSLPEYPDLQLHLPPVLDVIDYIEREGFTSIHASTPGTMGLLGLFTAKLMDIPVSGTYHTDIPNYVKSLTNDSFLEDIAWNYMVWFYNQMEEVMVPSESTRRQLIERGLAEGKVKPLPRWVDTSVFSPAKRVGHFWERYGVRNTAEGPFVFIYVGRISREKNLELLAEAFRDMVNAGFQCTLAVVGDGPYRKEMEEALEGCPAVFTGFLDGETLCSAYASADVFVFPSATDTFGNVVLEAQASGLPVVVSDGGGPKELMENGITGLIIRANDRGSLAEAMLFFIADRSRAASMGRSARHFTETKGVNPTEAYSTILRNEPGQRCAGESPSPALV